MVDINQINITLMRDFRKEYFNLPPNVYLEFSPVMSLNTHEYPVIDPNRKDPTCYIKHKYKDLWVYEENNNLIFKPLQKDIRSFGKYVPPKVFFLEYIEEPIFFIYKPLGFGVPKISYLYYIEISNKIYITWVDYFDDATKFKFTEINLDWTAYDDQNVFAKPQ